MGHSTSRSVAKMKAFLDTVEKIVDVEQKVKGSSGKEQRQKVKSEASNGGQHQ